MPSSKRQRKRQGRQARQDYLRARQRKARRQRQLLAVVGVVVIVSLVAAFFGTGGDGGEDVSTADRATTSTTEAPAVSPVGTAPCPAPDGSSPPRTTFDGQPPPCIDPGRTYRARVGTDVGTFVIALDAARAPTTVNNFVFLARYHAYDGVPFHRVVPGFVVQGGDVQQAGGRGGPGYNIPDELPGAADTYQIGDVAMANEGTPNTGGSQFFVITGEQGVRLPKEYARFGTVVEGLDVVKRIEADGAPDQQPPNVVHRITRVTIEET
ncbi:MAG TPA: peptidylprolyl isomerase [Acidimicrobiales bacterium]|nr:peptidylprolyl isomerase [Acidimicrobiales bacterium]